jgi:hypothetical protein
MACATGVTYSRERLSPFSFTLTTPTFTTIGTLEKSVQELQATCQKGSNTISSWNTNWVQQIKLMSSHAEKTMTQAITQTMTT